MKTAADQAGNRKELATLGGGCFWCLEPIFRALAGVKEVVVGYSGGTVANPSYEEVCTGTTGHAEVVQIAFDPEVISYEEILEVFFSIHDPTTPNRQGADVGSQYRSIILYHNEGQKAVAEKFVQDLNSKKVWEAPVVTEIVPFRVFFRAEGYHQGYFEANPQQPYCRVVVSPKVDKFRKTFAPRLMKDPDRQGLSGP
jgi:peptide-methionine (S)-S-oxide reductase